MTTKKTKSAIVTVDIDRALYDELKARADKKRYKIKEYVNERLWLDLQKEKFLAAYAPFLSVIGEPEGNRITLHDTKIKQTVDVFLHDTQLYCEIDEKGPCAHIDYVMLLPELSKLYINRQQQSKKEGE